MAELLGRGVREVVHKGAGGAVHHSRKRRAAHGGFVVEEVDPTGASDCVGAAFLSMRLRGASASEAMRVACACGALAVTRNGPLEGTPSLAEVARFLADRGA